MRKISQPFSIFLLLIFLAGASIFYLTGVPGVPFHPDESTQLFMSGDLEMLWQQPGALFWQKENEADPRQRYRELDAPLTRSLIGLGRRAAGFSALAVDWDWGRTWLENDQAGALPSPALLLAGRWATAALFPFSLLFLFLASRKMANEFTAWVAILLLASNALVLLHTRRAMAEGPLLFTTTLLMWRLVATEKRPWLTALPAALAFCAKQTLAALAPVGLLSVFWPPQDARLRKVWNRSSLALLYIVVFTGIVYLLNPFAWQHPVQAGLAALRARQELARAQVLDRPGQSLDTPAKKLIGLVGSLFLTPPLTAETANYQAETRSSEAAYLANPLHTLFRSLPGGTALMALTLAGFLAAAVQARYAAGEVRRRLIVLLAATFLQGAALLLFIPLPWQRYYLPLVPFTCLWEAYALDQVRGLLMQFVITPAGGKRGGSYTAGPRR